MPPVRPGPGDHTSPAPRLPLLPTSLVRDPVMAKDVLPTARRRSIAQHMVDRWKTGHPEADAKRARLRDTTHAMDDLETQERLHLRQRAPLGLQPGCEDQGGGSPLGHSRCIRP